MKRRLAIRTIPVVGAISMAGCAPVRDNVEGATGGTVVGDWELRRYQGYGYSQDYPVSQTYTSYYGGTCTQTTSILVEIEDDGRTLTTNRRESEGEGCYYTNPYNSTSQGSWEELVGGAFRIELSGSSFECTLEFPELDCNRQQTSWLLRAL